MLARQGIRNTETFSRNFFSSMNLFTKDITFKI